eukprot:TRINITY_DN5541_c0_g1_i1.p1 TRINITY_DN5541_c0_g1~~TRINITY_DN5541_c0_g1_i1.p1  ORF type:complete len:662 (-),score=162.87 TRINITY_DN5541_c0_g1_i1:2115-4100(-)
MSKDTLYTIVSGDGLFTAHLREDEIAQSQTMQHMVPASTQFKEGKEGCIRFADMNHDVLRIVVSFLRHEVPLVASAASSVDILLAAAYLQLPELQSIAAERFARNFDEQQSFGAVPDEMIQQVLNFMPAQQLVHAERVTRREGRTCDFAEAWSTLSARIFSDSPPDDDQSARDRCITHAVTTQLASCTAQLSAAAQSSIETLGSDLRTLRIRNAQLDSQCVVWTVDRCDRIQTIDIADNKYGGRMIVHVMASLAKRSPITCVDVSHNGIGAEGVASLAAAMVKQAPVSAEVLQQYEEIASKRTVSLLAAHNLLTDVGLSAVSSALSDYPLLELHLSGNPISVRGAQVLADVLRRSNCALQKLFVADCALAATGVAAIATSLSTNHSLLVCDLSRNVTSQQQHSASLQAAGTALAQMLRVNVTLQQLRLDGNSLRVSDWAFIARTLAQNTVLQMLSCGGEPISEDAAQMFARALKHNASLHTLLLNQCKLAASHLMHLTGLLVVNTALTWLDISHAQWSGSAAQHIASALQHNQTLTRLDMAGSGQPGECLASEGCAMLARGLKRNRTLRRLNLASHCIGDEGVLMLAVVLPRCGLTLLSLRNNLVADRGARALAAVRTERSETPDRGPFVADLSRNAVSMEWAMQCGLSDVHARDYGADDD